MRSEPTATTGRRQLRHEPMRAASRGAMTIRQSPTAQIRLPAPPRAAARSPHNPASGLEPCPALPSGCTLRNITDRTGRYFASPRRSPDRDATARCDRADSGTDTEYLWRLSPRLRLRSPITTGPLGLSSPPRCRDIAPEAERKAARDAHARLFGCLAPSLDLGRPTRGRAN